MNIIKEYTGILVRGERMKIHKKPVLIVLVIMFFIVLALATGDFMLKKYSIPKKETRINNMKIYQGKEKWISLM